MSECFLTIGEDRTQCKLFVSAAVFMVEKKKSEVEEYILDFPLSCPSRKAKDLDDFPVCLMALFREIRVFVWRALQAWRFREGSVVACLCGEGINLCKDGGTLTSSREIPAQARKV